MKHSTSKDLASIGRFMVNMAAFFLLLYVLGTI